MPWVAAAVNAGSSVLGGILGGNGQSAAAKKIADATGAAQQFAQNVYGTEQTNLNPYINTGHNALYSLGSLYGLNGSQPGGAGNGAEQAFTNFQNTDAYQFPLQQGELAANRALAAQGLTGSGAQGKALTQYGQGYASQGFNGYIQQLAGLAGMGQTAATNLGSSGNAAAQTNLSGATQTGNAQAAGILGPTNSMLNGLQGAVGAIGANNPSSTAFGPSSLGGQIGSGISSGLGYLFGTSSVPTPSSQSGNGIQ
jgi:hypothetical protein